MKSLWLYILMSGLPILGIAVILFLGRDHPAPASVKGTWLLEGVAQSRADAACEVTLSWQGQPQFVISQSGPDLTIVFNDADHTTLKGYLDNLTISGQEVGSSALLSFRAEVDRQAEPDRLYGTLEASSCGEPIIFEGTRQPPEQDASGASWTLTPSGRVTSWKSACS